MVSGQIKGLDVLRVFLCNVAVPDAGRPANIIFESLIVENDDVVINCSGFLLGLRSGLPFPVPTGALPYTLPVIAPVLPTAPPAI